MVVRVLLFLDATLDVVVLASVGSLLIACFLKTNTHRSGSAHTGDETIMCVSCSVSVSLV